MTRPAWRISEVPVHPQLLWDRAYLPGASLLWLSLDTTRLMVALAATVPHDLRQAGNAVRVGNRSRRVRVTRRRVSTPIPTPDQVINARRGAGTNPHPTADGHRGVDGLVVKWHDESLWVPAGRSDWLTRTVG